MKSLACRSSGRIKRERAWYSSRTESYTITRHGRDFQTVVHIESRWPRSEPHRELGLMSESPIWLRVGGHDPVEDSP